MSKREMKRKEGRREKCKNKNVVSLLLYLTIAALPAGDVKTVQENKKLMDTSSRSQYYDVHVHITC